MSVSKDFLTAITRDVRRTQIATFDVESKAPKSEKAGFTRAFLIGFYDGEQYLGFRNILRPYAPVLYDRMMALPPEDRAIAQGGCIDRFCRFLFGTARAPNMRYESRTHTLYAHNGGRFDATFLLAWLRKHRSEFDVRITAVSSRAQRIQVTRKVRTEESDKRKRTVKRVTPPSWTFIDSVLLLPMSLEAAGQTFCGNDDEGQKQKFDLDTDSGDPRWEEYNAQDCIVLHKSLSSLRDMIEDLGGEMGITAPSTSMKLFRRSFLHEPIARNRHFPGCNEARCRSPTDACLHDWIRKGYHGGRTEIFSMTAPPGMRYYDLNSSYPTSMREKMPTGEALVIKSASEFWDRLPVLEKSSVGFVEATVTIPENCHVPPLPYVNEDNKKLLFPVGTFRGVWSWDELKLIFDPYVGGEIVQLHRCVWFRASIIFKSFVDTLYAYRLASKKDPTDKAKAALSELAKLLLNAHYGKYGMNPLREEIVTIDGGEDPWPGDEGSPYKKEGSPLDGDHLHGSLWSIPVIVDAPYMIPQIAAQVTALSRVMLWRACVTCVTLT